MANHNKRDDYYIHCSADGRKRGPFTADQIMAFLRVFETITVSRENPVLGEQPITLKRVIEKSNESVENLIDVTRL